MIGPCWAGKINAGGATKGSNAAQEELQHPLTWPMKEMSNAKRHIDRFEGSLRRRNSARPLRESSTSVVGSGMNARPR